MRFLLLCLLLPLLSGCGSILGPIACTMEGSFAISLRVVDAVTGAPAAAGASITVRDGAYEEIVHVPADAEEPSLLAFGAEREGTYTVYVEKPGYQPWQRSNIRVGRQGRCEKLAGAALTARLQPQ